jgi:hypothetical protein
MKVRSLMIPHLKKLRIFWTLVLRSSRRKDFHELPGPVPRPAGTHWISNRNPAERRFVFSAAWIIAARRGPQEATPHAKRFLAGACVPRCAFVCDSSVGPVEYVGLPARATVDHHR